MPTSAPIMSLLASIMLLHLYQSSCSVRIILIYSVLSILKSIFLEQFSKYANMFFLFTVCIQQIPGVSPTNRYTTIAPLAVVLLASAVKEFQEDLVRRSRVPPQVLANPILCTETTPVGCRAQRAQSQGPRARQHLRRQEMEGHIRRRRRADRKRRLHPRRPHSHRLE